MKILQMFPFFSLSYYGGIFTVGYSLSKALAARGHDVVVYTTDLKFSHQLIDSTDIKVHPFPARLKLAGFLITPAMQREMRRNLREFDIIHCHNFRGFQEILLDYYARRYGIPYLIDAHGSTLRTGKRFLKWLFDIFFGYRILRNAARVIAETEVGVKEYEEMGTSRDKIVLIYPPFPVEEYSQLPPPGYFREKFKIHETHIILFLGRINWIKGLDFIVKSFRILHNQREDVILVIVGNDDGYKSTLEGLINKLDLQDKVLFTGFLAGEKKKEALVDTSIMVQTSIYEQGLSLACVEAILCNTPIIVSKNTGAGEDILRMGGGYVIKYGNEEEMVTTINEILDRPGEAADTTLKMKKYIETNMSMAKRIEEYEKLYIQCIEESRYKKGNRK